MNREVLLFAFLRGQEMGVVVGVFVFMRSALKSSSEDFPGVTKQECWGLMQYMLVKCGSASAASNLISGFSPNGTLDQSKLRMSYIGFLIAAGLCGRNKNIYRPKFLKVVSYLNLRRMWNFTHWGGSFALSNG